jgi:hypothetical protein
MEVSELLPHFAGIADDVTLIRSMLADNINHNGACLQMNTGEQAFSRPSLGSWATYGLGTVNANLPGFVVLSPAQPAQGAPLWGASFLPASHQGTLVSDLNKEVTQAYGVLFKGIAGIGDSSARAAFVIGKGGEVKYAEQTPTPKDLPNFAAVKAALAS